MVHVLVPLDVVAPLLRHLLVPSLHSETTKCMGSIVHCHTSDLLIRMVLSMMIIIIQKNMDGTGHSLLGINVCDCL